MFNELDTYGVEAYRVWEDSAEQSDGVDDGAIFSQEGKVTISGVNRAKGNEAATVYVLGLEEVENNSRRSNVVQRRNEAFVAITRSRGWCHLTGVEDGVGVFDEVESILDQFGTDQDPVVSFPAPNPQDLENEMESTVETTLDRFIDS